MDENTLKVLQLFFSVVSTLGLAIIGYLTLRANQNALVATQAAEVTATRATAAVREVKTTLATTNLVANDKLDTLTVASDNAQRMGEAIHTLVNSQMGAQLSISSGALRRIADLTHDPQDVALADEARRLLEAHNSKQAVVDSKPPPAATATGKGTGTPVDQASSNPQGNNPKP